MREIEGYVLISMQPPTQGWWMHGPSVHYPYNFSESFKTNGMVPFESVTDLYLAEAKINASRRVHRAKKARIEMTIAETLEEMEQFEKLRGLILIVYTNLGTENERLEFLGKTTSTGTKLGSFPGSILETNGFRGFASYPKAMNAYEAVEQEGYRAQLAKFKLRSLGDVKKLNVHHRQEEPPQS